MDKRCFDRSIRSLTHTTEHISRRASLRTLSAAGLAAALANPFMADAKSKGKKKGKRKKKHKSSPNPASPPPSPVTRLDAACPGPVISNFGYSGNARRAQSFTALSSGSLVMAQLVLDQQFGTDRDYVLRLSPVDSSGIPTNDVLAETSLPDAAVSVGLTLVTFTFASPFSVVAGTVYALVLTRPGGGNVFWQFHEGNSCSGHLFASADQTAQFAAGENLEFVFTTFVSS